MNGGWGSRAREGFDFAFLRRVAGAAYAGLACVGFRAASMLDLHESQGRRQLGSAPSRRSLIPSPATTYNLLDNMTNSCYKTM